MATTQAQTLPKGIKKLISILEHLNKPPKLTLENVKRLRLTVAYQNDHWGARHFIQESLPRIRYANPDLDIEVTKWRKERHEHWRPELELIFENGKKKFLDLNQKASSTILTEVMAIAGGDPWKAHVAEAKRTGMPIVPGEELYKKVEQNHSKKETLPNLDAFLKAHPQKAQEKRRQEGEKQTSKQKAVKAKKPEAKQQPSAPTTPSTVPQESTVTS